MAVLLSACSNDATQVDTPTDSQGTSVPAIGAAYSESLGVLQSAPAESTPEVTQNAYHTATLNAFLDAIQGDNTSTTPITRPASSPDNSQAVDQNNPTTSVTSAQSQTPQVQPVGSTTNGSNGTLTVTTPDNTNTTPTVTTPDNSNTTPTVTTPDNTNTTPTVTTPDNSNTTPTVTTPDNTNTTPTVTTPDNTNTTPTVTTPDNTNTTPTVTTPDNTDTTTTVATPDNNTSTTEVTPESAPAQASATGPYRSYSTPGFEGQVRTDGTIDVTWPAVSGATGYNVYRASEFYKSVGTAQLHDTDINAPYYYYSVESYDANGVITPLGDGLTVFTDPAKATAIPPLPTHIESDYDLVFAEEFSSTTLDASKWTTSHLWGDEIIINSEEQYYVDILRDPDFGFNPFVLDGEVLTIRTIETPAAMRAKALNQKYLSGVMTSYDSFKFTYGYVEARAQLPRGRGFWAAFWLLNAYYVDLSPEIDIMEHLGQREDVVYHTYHYFDGDGKLRSTESESSIGTDFTAGYHNYAVEWKPGQIIFYIDGVAQHTVTDSNISSQDMYIIANTAVGGWWAGSPDSTTPFPGDYKIDYIRAYQKRGPQDDPPFSDFIDSVPFHDDLPPLKRSPNHRPAPDQWPEGYPGRAN